MRTEAGATSANGSRERAHPRTVSSLPACRCHPAPTGADGGEGGWKIAGGRGCGNIPAVARRPQPPIAQDASRADHVAEVLKAVAHPLRLRLVAILCRGEENVTALADKVGASQAIVSQQLRILRSHGLVAANREGGFARYRIVEQNLRGLVRCRANCGAE